MRATYATNLLELQEWCRAYDVWTPFPSNTLERFLIAMYQLPGYSDWGESHLNKWESLASCMIHVLIVAERMKVGLEAVVPRELYVIEARPIPAERLMHDLCKAAQQLTYGNPRNKTQRAKSRYSAGKLRNHLANIVQMCMWGIPSESRSHAIQDATLIMTGKL